ncbi:hypothetical protein [Alicycliphilus denitrificans]|uniref:hypothetical protein n=1 Tax=Alicycliphilus denitrificans TaxID=179636 RepID=UPI00384AD85B|nr:hypothetical protein [Klebsiella pneumoniae]
MLMVKILALLTFVSWLGATGERLYDCWRNEAGAAAPAAKLEQTRTERWSVGELRW